MKICPTCRTVYDNDSPAFCLNDGQALVVADNLNAANLNQAPKKTGGLPLVPAILGGFLLFAIVVGGAGVYLFRRGEEKARTNANTQKTPNQPETNISANAAGNLPSVQIESNKAAGAAPQTVASASSVRKPEKGNFYFPNFAFDGNSATAWCEGAEGAGESEWLKFEFDREVLLKQIKIEPGYFKNADLWAKNNRLAAVALQYSNGATTGGFRLRDAMEAQTINIENPIRTSSIKIIIDEHYPGTSPSDDTLVSEVSFVTEQ